MKDLLDIINEYRISTNDYGERVQRDENEEQSNQLTRGERKNVHGKALGTTSEELMKFISSELHRYHLEKSNNTDTANYL